VLRFKIYQKLLSHYVKALSARPCLRETFCVIADAIRVLEDGDFETAAILDYGDKLKHSFTAHPKIDPVTGLSFLSEYS
jgi:hypothetical protein